MLGPLIKMATQHLRTRKKRKSYSRDFKTDAVKLIVQQGYSIAEASRQLGIDYSVLRRWKNKLEGILKNSPKPNNREKALNIRTSKAENRTRQGHRRAEYPAESAVTFCHGLTLAVY